MIHNITDLTIQKAVDVPSSMTLHNGKEIMVEAKKRILFTLDEVYHYSFDVYNQKNDWKGNAVYHVRKDGKRKQCPYCKKVMNAMAFCPVLTEEKKELIKTISESKFRLRVLFDLHGIKKNNEEK